MTFTPNCAATGLGSLPLTDEKEACELVLSFFPEVPQWPQLPRKGFKENMYAQFGEHIPGVALEEARVYVKKKGAEEQIENFYEAVLSDDERKFSTSMERCSGLYAFLELKERLGGVLAVKGQIVGPVSFGLQVTDENRKPLWYDETYRDVIVKNIKMCARWQEKKLRELCATTIVSVDEPYLMAFGSAHFDIKHEEVIAALNEVFEGLRSLKMVHCCGNTDWSIITETRADILSFDAYSFSESFALYSKQLSSFLERGGLIAWGIVPSDEKIHKESVASLLKRFNDSLALLEKKGLSKKLLLERALITPSCGTGAQSEETAEKVFEFTSAVSKEMKKRNL